MRLATVPRREPTGTSRRASTEPVSGRHPNTGHCLYFYAGSTQLGKLLVIARPGGGRPHCEREYASLTSCPGWPLRPDRVGIGVQPNVRASSPVRHYRRMLRAKASGGFWRPLRRARYDAAAHCRGAAFQPSCIR
jgi:hypothetical protein